MPTVVPDEFGVVGAILPEGFDDGEDGRVEKTFSMRTAGVDPHTVGESACGVNGDAEGLGATGHESDWKVRLTSGA